MARVIQDTPDDPVGYIIRILQEMHEKQRIVRDLVSGEVIDFLNGNTCKPLKI